MAGNDPEESWWQILLEEISVAAIYITIGSLFTLLLIIGRECK
jgi:hypothetical protein